MFDFGQNQIQRQTQTLSPQAQQSVRLLALPSAELRTEVSREMAVNPVIEDVREAPSSSIESVSDVPADESAYDAPDADRYTETESPTHDDEAPASADTEPELGQLISSAAGSSYDYDAPDTDNYGGVDSEAQERRDRFFNSQTAGETLQEHLLKQVSLTDFTPEDAEIARRLIGDLSDTGYFVGSIPDLIMVTGRTADEIQSVLDRIKTFDPEGCGCTTLRECLLAQIDECPATPISLSARAVADTSLEDLAAGRTDVVCTRLHLTPVQLNEALKFIRSLDPLPGRAFQSAPQHFVTPDVHLHITPDGARTVTVDTRSIPEIRISKRYLSALANPNLDPKTRAYLTERVQAAEQLKDALANREETIRKIAQELVDVQGDYLLKKTDRLQPLTRREIGVRVGLHESTVSRTVSGKYMTCPRGTLELASLFSTAIKTSDGGAVSNRTVQERIKTLISAENAAAPLSDQKLSDLLKAEGMPVARRTVAKYREGIGIPSAAVRLRKTELP